VLPSGECRRHVRLVPAASAGCPLAMLTTVPDPEYSCTCTCCLTRPFSRPTPYYAVLKGKLLITAVADVSNKDYEHSEKYSLSTTAVFYLHNVEYQMASGA